jgi:hypothetical protein
VSKGRAESGGKNTGERRERKTEKRAGLKTSKYKRKARV